MGHGHRFGQEALGAAVRVPLDLTAGGRSVPPSAPIAQGFPVAAAAGSPPTMPCGGQEARPYDGGAGWDEAGWTSRDGTGVAHIGL